MRCKSRTERSMSVAATERSVLVHLHSTEPSACASAIHESPWVKSAIQTATQQREPHRTCFAAPGTRYGACATERHTERACRAGHTRSPMCTGATSRGNSAYLQAEYRRLLRSILHVLCCRTSGFSVFLLVSLAAASQLARFRLVENSVAVFLIAAHQHAWPVCGYIYCMWPLYRIS
jgi:hypothetical protein